jgi:hypothetical protein
MTQGLVADALVGGVETEPTAWTRNSQWLSMPTIRDGEQKYVMLMAVWNWTSNFFRIDPAGCAYTVDWGDGSAPENFANGVSAQHTFSWAGCSSGTLTTDGYRQCVVTVTPQDSRATFSSMTLSNRHTSLVLNSWSSGLLDFEFSAPYASAPVLSASSTAAQQHQMLEHVKSYSGMSPDPYTGIFALLTNLASVEGYDGFRVTTLNSFFIGCYNLRSIPYFDTSICGSFALAFFDCRSITKIPPYDYRLSSSMAQAFSSCIRVKTAENVNAPSSYTFLSTFNGMRSLTSIAGLVTTGSVTFDNFLSNTSALTNVPFFDTSRCVTATSMFQNSAVIDLPNLDFTKVVVGSSMFNAALSLRTIGNSAFPSLVTADNLFSGCQALIAWPSAYPRLTSGASMFNSCVVISELDLDLPVIVVISGLATGNSTLKKLRLQNTSNATNAALFVNNSTFLQSIEMDATRINTISGMPTIGLLRKVILTGLRYSVTVSAGTNVGRMTPAALDALYTSLGTAYTNAQVVTVTNNRGVDADTPSIATSKGWTVTGS